jgi:hypothetical protein
MVVSFTREEGTATLDPRGSLVAVLTPVKFSRDRQIVSKQQTDQLYELIRIARTRCSNLNLGLSVGIAAAIDPGLPVKAGKDKADARANNVKSALLELGIPDAATLAWSSTLTGLQRRESGAEINASADAVVVELICSVN